MSVVKVVQGLTRKFTRSKDLVKGSSKRNHLAYKVRSIRKNMKQDGVDPYTSRPKKLDALAYALRAKHQRGISLRKWTGKK